MLLYKFIKVNALIFLLFLNSSIICDHERLVEKKKSSNNRKQFVLARREIFCCDDYQLFMQFALSKPFGKKYDVDVQKFVTAYMDIQPHAPYNRQARKVAKERAALR